MPARRISSAPARRRLGVDGTAHALTRYVDTWTRHQNDRWRNWSHLELALNAIGDPPLTPSAVAVIGHDLSDGERMVAAIRLIRKLAAPTTIVVAGHVHPTAAWRKAVMHSGADRAVLIRQPKVRRIRGFDPLEGAVDLSDKLCPALHASQDHEGTLSVCGCHCDRMVLGRPHFERWCFDSKESCPQWRQNRAHDATQKLEQRQPLELGADR